MLEEFLISIMEFLQLHEVFPTLPEKLDEECKEHERFLNQMKLELEELKNLVTSLRSFALLGNIPESRIEYMAGRIRKKLPDRISLLERRLSAFKMFSGLHKLRKTVS